MKTVAVYPGRFQPFSLGHQAVYNMLSNDPAIDAVYIATSEKQDPERSPFSYDDKVVMMTKTGIPSGNIIKVKNPYNIKEIQSILSLDPEQDRLIYALGADDAKRFSYNETSPLQLLNKDTKMSPVNKHAYVKIIPQQAYNILGKKITHATDIRNMYKQGNDNDRFQIITDLYGTPDPELKNIFDKKLGVDQPQEGIIYGQERIYAGDQPVSVMREDRLACLRENIQYLQKQLEQLRDSLDYIDEKWTRKYKRSINCSNPRGFSQKAHCAGRKKK